MMFHKHVVLEGGRVPHSPINWKKGFSQHRHPARIYFMRRGRLEISWTRGKAILESPFMYWVPAFLDSFNRELSDFSVDFIHVDDALLPDFPNKGDVFSFSRPESEYWEPEWEDALSGENSDIRRHEGIKLMLSSLLRRLQKMNSSFIPSAKARRFQELLDEMDLHPERRLTLENMANRVHLSTGHFCRLFKEGVGVSPQGYRKARLMNLVLSRITGGASLKQISTDFDYSSPFALSRDFKKHFGVSPREHLRRHAQQA